MIIFWYLTTWSLLQKSLHILTSPVALWSSHSELCERVCPALKSSVLSAWIKRKSQLLGFELFFIWLEENEFSSVQSLSHVQLFVTLWTAVCQASLTITSSWSLLKLMLIESVMPSNHLILCHPFLLPPSIFPASESFLMSQFFALGGQSIGASASVSVLLMNIQHWFPLGWTGWISLQSKGLSRVFSNPTVQKHQFFGAQLSSWSNSHMHTWLLEKP